MSRFPSFGAEAPLQKFPEFGTAPPPLGMFALPGDWTPPGVLYRRFTERWQLDDFLKGNIWLSTLSYCRGCEGDPRVDRREAMRTYWSGVLKSNGPDDEHVKWLARKVGLPTSPEAIASYRFSGVTIEEQCDDAWLLCLSPRPDVLKYGDNCARIREPLEFMRLLSIAVRQQLNTGQRRIEEALFGPVRYGARDFEGRDFATGPLAFVKPPLPEYLEDEEVRAFWRLPGEEAQRLTVKAPDLRHLLDEA